jgi:hypothetical protein
LRQVQALEIREGAVDQDVIKVGYGWPDVAEDSVNVEQNASALGSWPWRARRTLSWIQVFVQGFVTVVVVFAVVQGGVVVVVMAGTEVQPGVIVVVTAGADVQDGVDVTMCEDVVQAGVEMTVFIAADVQAGVVVVFVVVDFVYDVAVTVVVVAAAPVAISPDGTKVKGNPGTKLVGKS